VSCYGCLRDIGHEAECPNEGVYAKRAGRVFYGVDLGTAAGAEVSTFRKESDGRLTLLESKVTLPREAPKTELRLLAEGSFTLPTPTPVCLCGDPRCDFLTSKRSPNDRHSA
jgi:hypothetical protein